MIDRFYSAQDGHNVQMLAPASISGGVASPAVSMKNYSHLSIFLSIGANPAPATAILIEACTAANGAGATAIPFDLFAAETANTDLLTAREPQTAAGYAPSGTADIFYVIEIDAAQLPAGFSYVRLHITNGANAIIASAHGLLSGSRYGGDQSPTVLV